MTLFPQNSVPLYKVHIIIENKSGISDPEGDTILHDHLFQVCFQLLCELCIMAQNFVRIKS